MKTKILLNTAGALAATLLVGCASIIDGGDKTITFKSSPPDAKVTVYNVKTGEAIASGTTPASIVLSRKSGYFQPAHYRVTIVKDGYKPYEVSVNSTINGWYAGNLVFGGLLGILIIDPATGAMWTFSPADYNADLTASTTSSTGPALKVMTLSELTPEQRSHLVPLASNQH